MTEEQLYGGLHNALADYRDYGDQEYLELARWYARELAALRERTANEEPTP